jgi:hypothetical protein
MNDKLLKKLKTFLFDEENKEFVGKSATDEQISQAESLLGVKFSDDYIEFIKLFGGAYAGLDIYAFENAPAMGGGTVISKTNDLRISHPEVTNTYVIADDGAGNPIMINQKGEIEIYYHDSGEIEFLSASLGRYIEEIFEAW